MKIQTGATVAIILNQEWARLPGISQFLSNGDNSETSIGYRVHNVRDHSHTLYAKVLDDDDSRGLWVELHTERKDRTTIRGAFLIPWNQLLGIAVTQHKLCPSGEKNLANINRD